jgi:hypothetical protein
MRTALLTCITALLLGACASEPNNLPPPDTLLYASGEELIDLYHSLPGASAADRNPKLVEALAAAHATEFKKANDRAERDKETFAPGVEARMAAEFVTEHVATNVGAKYIAVAADVTVPPFDFRDGKIRICWERSCSRDRPELVERLVNYVLRMSLPDPQGFEITPGEALARTLQAQAEASPDRTLHALYVAKIEGADPADSWGGIPIFQVRARLIKLLIVPANAPEQDMTLAEIAAAPSMYTASF